MLSSDEEPLSPPKEVASLDGCLLLALIFPVYVTYNTVVNAYVLLRLWRWFVVPFFSVPRLSLPLIAGLMLLVVWIKLCLEPVKQERTIRDVLLELGRRATMLAIMVNLVLLEGWIINTWFL